MLCVAISQQKCQLKEYDKVTRFIWKFIIRNFKVSKQSPFKLLKKINWKFEELTDLLYFAFLICQ